MAEKGRKGRERPLSLDREEYLRILEGVELETVALRECSAKIVVHKTPPPTQVSVDDEISFKIRAENLVEVVHGFTLTACSKGRKRPTIRISCSFELIYSAENGVTEEFMEIFSKGNVPLNSWPYFREFVQNITSRMNIPPLTLPLWK